MAAWAALFLTMLGTGFVQARHPGESIAFWQKAALEHRPRAVPNLVTMLESRVSQGSGAAANELGLLYAEGKLTRRDLPLAATYFAKGCELGCTEACANVAIQFLFSAAANSSPRFTQALARLEAVSSGTNAAQPCYLLGLAYETGRGRAVDLPRARELYARACELGDPGACKNLGRMRLYGQGGSLDPVGAAQALERACDAGDAQSCFYLAPLYYRGAGVPKDEPRARAILQKACDLGLREACEAVKNLSK